LENLRQTPELKRRLNHESPEFIRFLNPGDLRVAQQSCGLCHGEIIRNVDHSMMNHALCCGALLYTIMALIREELSLRSGLRRGRRATKVSKLHTGHRRRHSRAWHPAVIEPLRDSISAIRETFCAFSKKAAGHSPLSVCRPVRNQTADPIAAFPSAVSDIESHRSRFSRIGKKRDCTIRFSDSSVRTIIPAIIDRAVARRVTLCTPMIVRRQIQAGGANSVIRA